MWQEIKEIKETDAELKSKVIKMRKLAIFIVLYVVIVNKILLFICVI